VGVSDGMARCVNIEELLSRLSKVKKSGPGKWVACCPAHEDRSPSLAIKDSDGTILLHCFAGCSVEDVCGAIGVAMVDLFPPTDKKEWSGDKPIKFGSTRFAAIDALRCLAFEAGVVAIFAADMAEGRVLSPEDRERLAVSCDRLSTGLAYVEES